MGFPTSLGGVWFGAWFYQRAFRRALAAKLRGEG